MDPSRILLRSLLESYFNLEYILEENTNKKALAYIVWNTHEQNKFYESLNPSTQKGKSFQAKLNVDRFFSQTKILDKEKYQGAFENNEELLNLPEYQEIEKIYQSRKQIYKSRLKWYTVLDNFQSLEDLSTHLHLYGSYQFLYKLWSKDIHGTSISEGKLIIEKNGMTGLIQMRNPNNGLSIFGFTYFIVTNALSTFIKKLSPNDELEFKEWLKHSLSRYKSIMGKI
jgi:Family of unknown function (DUF5677)